jgi:flagellar hook-associated protein 3 FlgL
MALTTIGDLAQSFLLRQRNTDLKAQLGTLVAELSSGRTADVARHLSGSYSYLADVERNLALLEGYSSATNEARLFTDTMQDALDGFQTVSSTLGLDLMSAAQSGMPQVIANLSARATGDLGVMLSQLNTSVGGRFLFSGIDSDTPPAADAQTILTALRADLAGETTLVGIETALDTWFGPGGGYETVAYLGSTSSLAPFALGQGESVRLDLRADDAALRSLLKHTAMAALVGDATLAFPDDLRREMTSAAGKGLTFDQSGVTRIRADLGYAQSRIEESATRISAERTSFQTARTDLLAIDPYEPVTRLDDVQLQLEGLYTITARLSRLSLTNYLS